MKNELRAAVRYKKPIDDGGPLFLVTFNEKGECEIKCNLSVRDAMALHALEKAIKARRSPKKIAQKSYEIADALMQASKSHLDFFKQE